MSDSRSYKITRIAGGDTSQPLAMEKRLTVLSRYLKSASGRFLDCGCGCGAYVLALVERFGLDAHGIEYEEAKVKTAHLNPALRERVMQGDLEAIQLPSGSWDYAMLNEVLEHVPDDRKALEEIHRVLKPGGMLFIFSPNRWFPFETHGVRLNSSGRGIPNWTPFIPYLPLRFGMTFLRYGARNYWQGELARLVTSAGFTIIERTFVGLTFEGGSGQLPGLLNAVRPTLRLVANGLERVPLLKRFGLSQVLVCRSQ